MVIFYKTQKRIDKDYSFKEESISIQTDSLSIQKGEHLYKIRGCVDCHGKNLEGSVFMDDPLLMQINAPNLTKGQGGLPADFGADDWLRVLRHGVGENGKSLMMMPSQEYYQLTNEDLANLIAYCTVQDPVNTSHNNIRKIGPVGRLLMIVDKVTILPAEKIDHQAIPEFTKNQKLSVEYGQYLAVSCQGCHRINMQGGDPLAPGFPKVPNITSQGNIGNWNVEEFMKAIKTGKTPEGKTLDNKYMPWKSISSYTDLELKSIYLYLQNLPP